VGLETRRALVPLMSRSLISVGLFLLLLVPAAVRGDSWLHRDHLVRVSPDGGYYVAIARGGFTLAKRVGEGQWTPPDKIRVERVEVDVDGRRRQVRVPIVDPGDLVIGQGKLAHDPLGAHVLSGGQGLVLFERYGGMGSGKVITRLEANGFERFGWTLEDLFEPHVIASFSRSTSSIHWNRAWWVDEVDGVVALAYGGRVLGLPGLDEPAGSGWMGVPLDGSPPGPLAESVLRRRTTTGSSKWALQTLDAVLLRDSPDVEEWLLATLANEAATLRVRMRAEAALWLREVEPPLRLIQPTVQRTEVGGDLRAGPRPARGAPRTELAAWKEALAVRSDAISLLGLAQGGAALPKLRQVVAEGTKTERVGALSAIESLGDRGDQRELSQLLDEVRADLRVRAAAARGLGRTGDAELVQPLLARAQTAELELAGALFVALASLPSGPSALEEWVLAEPSRAVRVTRALGKATDPASVPLIDRLAREGLVESALVLPALTAKGEPGARAALELLGDGVGASGPFVEWLAKAPRPDAGRALLAAVDRAEPGNPPDKSLAQALHGSLQGDSLAPVVERLQAGHAADGTLILALQLGHSDIDPVHADAVQAAVSRHARADDPALEVVAQAGLQTRRPEVAALLVPLLAEPLQERQARPIAMLLRYTPEVEATEPLLAALDVWSDDPFVCSLVAEALGVRPIDSRTERRLLAFIRRGGAVCASVVVKNNPHPKITKALSDWLVAAPMSDQIYRVVTALAKSEDAAALPGLEAGLRAAHTGPLRTAAQALKKLGAPGLLALGRALEVGTAFDLQPLAALNEVKEPLPPEVEVGVRAALARADALDTTDSRRVQRMALLVLGKLDDDVVPLLVERLDSGSGAVGAIARQLRRLKDPRAAQALLRVVDTVEGKDRNAVLAALAEIPEPAVVPLLLAELLASDEGGRQEDFVVDMLRRALPEVEWPVGDRDYSSRVAAWREYARAHLPGSGDDAP